MNLDSRGRHIGQVTYRLAEARGPVPPFALVRRRHRQRARRHGAVVAAAVVAVAAVVMVQVGQHADEGMASRPARWAGWRPRSPWAGSSVGYVPTPMGVGAARPRGCPGGSTEQPGAGQGAVGSLWLGSGGGRRGGALWLTDLAQDTVRRVAPATGRTVATIGVPGGDNAPQGMTVAVGAGAVWVEYDLGTTVARIDPATNTVAATLGLPNPPAALAVSDQAVMVVTNESGVAYQIDPATNRVVASIPICRGARLWPTPRGRFGSAAPRVTCCASTR